MTRLLTRNDVAEVLTLDDCITAVEDVFRAYGEKRIAPPDSLGVHVESGTFHIKTAVTDLFAAKINANFPGNPTRNGLPTIQGIILLVDAQRGTPLAILDSTLITILRTAAASAVAARWLARSDARTMTIVGCGNQGRAHLDAMLRVRPITRTFAFDRSFDSAQRFARQASGECATRVEAVESLEEAIAASDLVVTCTTSRTAILDVRHLHGGMFIAAVGADNPDKQELSPELMAQARVVPDIIEQAVAMGDVHHAIEKGVMTREEIHGELPAIVAGVTKGRSNDDEVFIFDSTGTALQDAAAAAIAFRRAVERNIGHDLDFQSRA